MTSASFLGAILEEYLVLLVIFVYRVYATLVHNTVQPSANGSSEGIL